MRWFLAGLLLFQAFILTAVITENSASLNSLCGITALSTGVSDYAMSPVIGTTGLSSSYCSHFGTRNGSVFGIHSAENFGILFLAAGMSTISTTSYRWQDQYLSLSLGTPELGLGYTQHHNYEKVGNGEGSHDFSGDIGFRAMYGGYGSEFKFLRLGSSDKELHLTTIAEPYPGVSVATTYIWGPDKQTRFATATSYDFDSLVRVQMSWQSDPSRLGFGAFVNFQKFEIGYAIRTHPDLNLTHAVDIGVRW